MDTGLSLIWIFFLGLLAGGALVGLAWFLADRARTRSGSPGRDWTVLLQQARDEIGEKDRQLIELNRELSGKEADLRNLAEKLNLQKKEIETLQERFRIEFRNLANEILEEKSKKFTEQNRLKLDEILKPLGDKLKDFEKKVEETYDKEAQQRFSLKEEVKRLAELNRQVSQQAENLTLALKGDSKAQGNWGEIILESILTKSGLVRDREYVVQPSFPQSDGRRLQPDVVVHYPGNRSLVIDSKVSLTAYERYMAAVDEQEKETALKEHLNSVRNHIRELGGKNYQDIYQLKSLDFVMLFMPVEPAYLLAIQQDSELWQVAYEKRILLISPTNLIAALKMVASLWQQEHQNRNAQEIAGMAGSLYDKFVLLMEDLVQVGKKIDETQKAYRDSMNKISEGRGNLIRRVEQIRELGARTKKQLPRNLLDRSAGDEDPESEEGEDLPSGGGDTANL